MVNLVYCLTNLLFDDISLLYYYVNLISSIILCLSSEDIYLSLDISLSYLFVIVSKLFCSEFLERFVILLAILLPIKAPVASAVFLIIFFEEVLSA